jgi:hypothetical protein
MKTFLLILLVVSTLAGCVVAPVYPDAYSSGYDRPGYAYPYGYPGYGYGHGYYRHRYYWRQSP